MAKFERLKWIPMIMDAYNEARVRTQRPDTDVGRTSPEVRSVSVTQTSPPQDSTAPRLNGNRHAANPHRPKRSLAVRPVKRHRYNQPRPASVSPYTSVIRELRDTKHKLRQLETIHVRLNELQSSMEQRLSELAERVSSSKPHQEEPPTVSNRDSQPGTAQGYSTPPRW